MKAQQLKNSILQMAVQGKLVPPACRQAGRDPETLPKKEIGAWFVYVIECDNGSYYRGFTEDLPQRWQQHCNGTAADWTKHHKPKQVYYWEKVYSREAAVKREGYLKSGIGRDWFNKEVVEKPENWEPASVLLERIRTEKQRLIKEGKVKCNKHESIIFRRDNSHYEIRDGEEVCIDDEIPFDIPDFVSEELAERSKPVVYGDLLFTLTGENKEEIGKAVAFLGNEKTVIGGDLATFKNHEQNPMYLSYVINSPYAIQQKAMLGTGDITVHISCDKLASILVPLPPLTEQNRIVGRIKQFSVVTDKL